MLSKKDTFRRTQTSEMNQSLLSNTYPDSLDNRNFFKMYKKVVASYPLTDMSSITNKKTLSSGGRHLNEEA
jgi:hypothetical protein